MCLRRLIFSLAVLLAVSFVRVHASIYLSIYLSIAFFISSSSRAFSFFCTYILNEKENEDAATKKNKHSLFTEVLEDDTEISFAQSLGTDLTVELGGFIGQWSSSVRLFGCI